VKGRSINPTVRGFAIIFVIAGIVTALQLDDTLRALLLVVNIAFLLAIAFFLYRLWRERREEISTWGRRSQIVLYGSVVLAVANIVAAFATSYPTGGGEALAFFGVLGACFFAAWRVWKDEHTYGY
jgi:hypothetical protein